MCPPPRKLKRVLIGLSPISVISISSRMAARTLHVSEISPNALAGRSQTSNVKPAMEFPRLDCGLTAASICVSRRTQGEVFITGKLYYVYYAVITREPLYNLF